MKTIQLDASGKIPSKILKQYGGPYSFLKKAFVSGISLAGLEYKPETADHADRKVSHFEKLQDGLAIRVNMGQKSICFLFSFTEIQKIRLMVAALSDMKKADHSGKRVGYLSLSNGQEKLQFFVPYSKVGETAKYFEAIEFTSVFELCDKG
ncbi:hypothetical protein V6R21_06855 [Limibacter armeniacum]|uniref:hypothetical protein n=1 Tax=Limibacter armeniacum TaxID=466084 RepID=UPI002FE5A7F6